MIIHRRMVERIKYSLEIQQKNLTNLIKQYKRSSLFVQIFMHNSNQSAILDWLSKA